MKNKAELKNQQVFTKAFCEFLVEQLEGKVGDLLVDGTTTAVHGKQPSYGDTQWHHAKASAKEARKQVIEGLLKIARNVPKPKLPDAKVDAVKRLCNEAKGKFTYELKVDGEYLTTFKADGAAQATKFAKTLGLKKVELKRLTKREQMNRRTAFACDPRSETYWSS